MRSTLNILKNISLQEQHLGADLSDDILVEIECIAKLNNWYEEISIHRFICWGFNSALYSDCSDLDYGGCIQYPEYCVESR